MNSKESKQENGEQLTDNDRERFIKVLNNILQLLKKSNLRPQQEIVGHLIKDLYSENTSAFIKKLNGVDMWGELVPIGKFT